MALGSSLQRRPCTMYIQQDCGQPSGDEGDGRRMAEKTALEAVRLILDQGRYVFPTSVADTNVGGGNPYNRPDTNLTNF